MVSGKENVGNFVFCRMAPSVMTSADSESQNCFRFLLLFQVRFAQKVCERFSPFFSPAGSPTGVDDCCKIWFAIPQGTLPQKQIFVIFGHFPSDPVAILFCPVSIRSICCIVMDMS